MGRPSATERFYVQLLDEVTADWRPVDAIRVDADTFRLLAPDHFDPEVETWEFPPGSVVRTELLVKDVGRLRVAVERLSE